MSHPSTANHNESDYSFLRQLTTWHCSLLPLSAGHAAIRLHLLPAGPTAANLDAVARIRTDRNVHRILVRGSMDPCHLRRRKLWKFHCEMVHAEVYLNKYVVSIAPFSTPACPDCSQNITLTQKRAHFCMFSISNFSSKFPGGQLTPFAPMCGRPCRQMHTPCYAGRANDINTISHTTQLSWTALSSLFTRVYVTLLFYIDFYYGLYTLTLLVGHQEVHPVCKNWVML